MILLALALLIDPLSIILEYQSGPGGASLSVSGDTAFVGAPNQTVSGSPGRGEVLVYVRNGTTWSLQATLTASDGGAGDAFGTSVCVNGNIAIVGAAGDSNPGFGQGSAYAFTRSGSIWSETTKLVDGDGIGGGLGSTVFISADWALAGSPYRAPGGGVVYYERLGAFWFQVQTVSPADGAAGDQFGSSLSVYGDEAVIGSPFDDDHGLSSGSAYVFSRAGSMWNESAKLTGTFDNAGDTLGRAVSLFGDRIALGSPGFDSQMPAVTDSGSVLMFERIAGSWQESARLIGSNLFTGQRFGFSVVAYADGVLVGNDSSENVVPFASIDGVWCKETAIPNTNDDVGFGKALGYDSGHLLIGAPGAGLVNHYRLTRNSAFTSFCLGDGSGTPCPCNNNGAPGHGCGSSVEAAGAQLTVSGNDMLCHDTVTLSLSGTGYFAPGLYFQGTQPQNGGSGVVLGDGLACVGGTAIRLAVKTANAGMSVFPDSSAGDPLLSVRGQIPAIGGTRYYQVWYRNNAVFCDPATFNLSNGVSVLWVP